MEPHADLAVVLLERRYIHDSVAFVALLDCALSRVTLLESLAVNQELILLAATVMPLLLAMKLIVFAAPVVFLLLVGFSGARRRDCDAASPGGSGANLCFRRDPDALAVGAAPLRCAPRDVARLRGQREAEAAGSVVDSDFSSLFHPCMSPIDRHRLVSDVVDGRCTLHARLSTNSFGIGHGTSHHVVHEKSCVGIHANSRGASAHGNSRLERGCEVSGETKTLSTSTLSRVWRLAVGENLPLQQASESLHEEAWVGRVNSSNLRISQEVEIKKGCVVTVSHLPTPDFTTSAPGCGRKVRSWLGWTLMGKTDSVVRSWLGWTSMGKTGRCELWLFRGVLRGGDVFFFSPRFV